MKNILYLLVFMLIIASCDDPITVTTEQQVAVEGYLYANQSANNIRLTSVLTPDDSLIQAIDDAVIDIGVDGQIYTLNSVGDGFYENPNLIFEPNKTYDLSFDYFGNTISAQTVIPEPIDNLVISETEIAITQITTFGNPGGGTFPDPVAVTWDNSDGAYYFVSVDNMETSWQYVNLMRVPEEQSAYHFASSPQVTDVFSLDARRNLPQYGTYRVIVFKVNPEYAALYENLSNSSLDLSEPATNVVNGAGIFTGVSSDTIWLEVRKG